MPLTAGSRLGVYEVTALIGEGGMGQVYRARDTKLNRDVALKVLPEAFAADPDRLARFTREAHTLASLNHPHIAQIHGLEESSGVRALVMELVEGDDLSALIAQGALPVPTALPIAKQIADALEAAHEQGIVHRDLKPANVKVRADGFVKVLDFGLAKALAPDGSGSSAAAMLSNSPTLTTAAFATGYGGPGTQIGMILGTAAYMAPEQARGRSVDKRADIWAFGCVLYEMLTGQRPFPGEDVAETIGAVIHKEPDWQALPAGTPPAVRLVLERCLRKDPRQRLRDIGDVRLALDGAFDAPPVAPSTETPARPAISRRTKVAFAAAAVALALVTGLSVWVLMRPSPSPPVRLSAVHAGPGVLGGTGTDIVLSPDGRRIVYLAEPATPATPAERQIFVRALDQLTVTPIGPPGIISNLFLSPDGQWVGFTDGTDRGLRKIAITGGAPVTICKGLAVLPFSATWGDGGQIIYSVGINPGQPLWRVASAGGTPEEVLAAKVGESYLRPSFLPGGHAILFDSGTGTAVEDRQIEVLTLQTGARKVVVHAGVHAQYVASRYLVFATEGALRAVRFDLDRLEAVGDPVPVVEGVVTKANGTASFSASLTGTLVYIQGSSQLAAKRTLVWVDRQGREEAIPVPERAYAYARLSPDQTRLALDVRDEQNDIFMWDLARKTFTRLTTDPGLNRKPVWTWDSKRVAFSVTRDGAENVFWRLADGSQPAEALTTSATNPKGSLVPQVFSRDNARLIVSPPGPPYDQHVLTLDGARRLEPLLSEAFDEMNPEISPDGRWIAYQANESGRAEIYVRPYPDVKAGGRWTVSTQAGATPAWSADGRQLFYMVGGMGGPAIREIMSVPIQPGATFSFGTPTSVVKGQYLAPQAGRSYDVAKDGRFLMIKDAHPSEEANALHQIVVVQNWFDELKRLAP